MNTEKKISFDMISQNNMQIEDDSYDDYIDQSVYGQGVNINGNNNTIHISFGDLKRKKYEPASNEESSEEVESFCDNQNYGTGEFCERFCSYCEGQGAKYDRDSTWWGLPIPLQIITLPLVLPFIAIGSMHRGTYQIITETQIEYKKEESILNEKKSTYKEEFIQQENELSESAKEFIDKIAEITGETPIYTEENYNNLMYSSTFETGTELKEVTTLVAEEITDIQKQFNEYLKTA